MSRRIKCWQRIHFNVHQPSPICPLNLSKFELSNTINWHYTYTERFIDINNIDITKLSAGKLIDFRLKNIGFVFQSFNLIPVLTAKENVEFIMLLQGAGKTERLQRVQQLFKEIGLEDKLNSRPAELSGGQQQRVAVARALASKPRFVLADEPTANLDSKSAANPLDIMEMLNKEEKITFLFSTHDQRVIQRARRVVTLVDGAVAEDTSNTMMNGKL